jgi:hypothetical protein
LSSVVLQRSRAVWQALVWPALWRIAHEKLALWDRTIRLGDCRDSQGAFLMKKLSKKGVLLFAGAMALCAFVLPSVASAASWGVVGTHHTLDTPNIGFTSPLAGGTTSSCTRSSLTTRVASAQNLEITSGSFGGLCTFETVSAGRCTLTAVPTRFPWTATATTTTNLQIHGFHIDARLDHIPGAGASCGLNGAEFTVTGTLTGGIWTGNASHTMDFSNAEGLVLHSVLGNNQPTTTRGFISDTQNSLVVNP